jgi:pimeloyl-ACP methyl ester carboxylesterase
LKQEFRDIAGIRTFCVSAGDGGMPVVLLHGSSPGACTEINWGKNIEALAADGMTVHAFDQPGFGNSDLPQDYAVEFRVEHARAFLNALGLDRFVLVGNSMGGYIAARIAIEDRRTRGLVLVAPVPLLPAADPAAAEKARAHTAKLQAYTPGLDNMRALTSGTIIDHSTITEELVRRRYEMSIGRNFEAQTRRAAAARPRPIDIRTQPPACPALLIWGADDGSVSVDWAVPLCRALPLAQLHVFNGAGHWPQWEQADAFNALVGRFVRSCASA